jgi:hypothetical protein
MRHHSTATSAELNATMKVPSASCSREIYTPAAGHDKQSLEAADPVDISIHTCFPVQTTYMIMLPSLRH